jgi:hypothetical protein
MLEKNILFYQANFDPEVNRMLKALEINNLDDFNLFKAKTLNIVREILSLSTRSAEREEWSTIYNLVDQSEFASLEEKDVLSKYGVPFSNKFALQFMI